MQEAALIDLLFVSLFQLAAGEPSAAPPSSDGPLASETAPTLPGAADVAPPTAAGPTAAVTQTVRHCRREQVTGSNIIHRVCRTDAEEAAFKEQSEVLLRGAMPMGRHN